MSEGLRCSECHAMYHHTIQCSLKAVPLPVWPMYTTPEVDALLLAHTEAMVKAVEGLRQNSHIHHGSYVQGHNHAIDKAISAIERGQAMTKPEENFNSDDSNDSKTPKTITPEEVLGGLGEEVNFDWEGQEKDALISMSKGLLALLRSERYAVYTREVVLQSLLAMPEKDAGKSSSFYSTDRAEAKGYNQCLSEQRAIITERLVKE